MAFCVAPDFNYVILILSPCLLSARGCQRRSRDLDTRIWELAFLELGKLPQEGFLMA